MEIYKKLDAESIEIAPEAIVQEKITKTLEDLQSDLKQAQDSLVYVQQRHADEIAPIQATIDLMQKRVDEAKKLGLVKKELVEITPVVEPIETLTEDLIIK